jgi:hypothetical protein
VGCGSNTAACLRSLPLSTIVWRLFVATAQLDGEPPVTAANCPAKIASTLNVSAAAATAIAAEYPLSRYSSPSVALGAVGTDAIFACPALTAEQSLAAYTPTYPYEFNDVNAPQRYLPPVGFPYGAAHESECSTCFALSNTAYPGDLSASQEQLAHAMKQTGRTSPAPVRRSESPEPDPRSAPPARRDGLRGRTPVRVLGQGGLSTRKPSSLLIQRLRRSRRPARAPSWVHLADAGGRLGRPRRPPQRGT